MLLDLRALLLAKGHAGKCVRCFFGLLGDMNQTGSLSPLKHWLEHHVEVEITANGEPLGVLPLRLGQHQDLDSFCHAAIDTLRYDRVWAHERMDLRLRYK